MKPKATKLEIIHDEHTILEGIVDYVHRFKQHIPDSPQGELSLSVVFEKPVEFDEKEVIRALLELENGSSIDIGRSDCTHPSPNVLRFETMIIETTVTSIGM